MAASEDNFLSPLPFHHHHLPFRGLSTHPRPSFAQPNLPLFPLTFLSRGRPFLGYPVTHSFDSLTRR